MTERLEDLPPVPVTLAELFEETNMIELIGTARAYVVESIEARTIVAQLDRQLLSNEAVRGAACFMMWVSQALQLAEKEAMTPREVTVVVDNILIAMTATDAFSNALINEGVIDP